MPEINPLLSRSTLIQYEVDNESYQATGFFYENQNGVFLVTNKHVVEGEREEERSPNTIEIELRQSVNISRLSRATLDLDTDNGNRAYETFNENIDIAVIPLDIELDEFGNTAYSPDDIYQEEQIRVSSGDQAIIVGYPRGITDPQGHFPIIRNALISSHLYGFGSQPYFLVDARMHQGASGSPVLSQPSTMQQTSGGVAMYGEPVTKLLGVHSATLAPPLDEEILSEAEEPETIEERIENLENRIEEVESLIEPQLDLNKVWHAGLIEELV